MTDQLQLIQDFPFEFYGEMYVAYLASDRQFYIRMNDVGDGMGLRPAAQRRRIQEDEGIAHYLVNMMADTPYQGGYRRKEVTFLNIHALPYWLGTIDAKRVKPEIYEKIARFKRSFAETAWKVYRSDLMPPEVLAEMDAYEVPARAEIDGAMDQLRSLTKKLDKIEGRLGVIEARMSAEAIINTRQQWQIKAMIETVPYRISNFGQLFNRIYFPVVTSCLLAFTIGVINNDIGHVTLTFISIPQQTLMQSYFRTITNSIT